MPDDFWNESASFSSILAQCERIAVVYRSNLPSRQDSYEYDSGDNVMIMISSSLETAPILEEACQILDIQDMEIICSAEKSGVTVVSLSDQKAGLSGGR